MFEHARFREPRRDHGYCTDDVARALAVAVVREGSDAARVSPASSSTHSVPTGASTTGGRRTAAGLTTWAPTTAQGRALFGLGVAGSVSAFDAGAAAFDSPSPRANAYAALGAAELLAVRPGHAPARAAASAIHRPARRSVGRPALAVAGGPPCLRQRASRRGADRRGRRPGTARSRRGGRRAPRWLAETELRDGHFSFTPAGGWAAGRADAGVRPAADRGRGDGRGVRPAPTTRPATSASPSSRCSQPGGSSARTTRASRSSTPSPAAAATGSSAKAATRTRAPSRRSRRSPRFRRPTRSAPSSSSVETIAAPTLRSAAP